MLFDSNKLKQVINRLGQWKLTGLGVISLILVVVLASVIGIGILYSPVTNQKEPANNQPTVGQVNANRIFTTDDAIDFIQLLYASYLGAIAAEPPGAKAAVPPYDSTVMIKRLQVIQAQLSPSLYKTIEASYRQSALVATIKRDEVLCGLSAASSFTPSLRLSSKEAAVIAVSIQRSAGVDSLEVAVDLTSRLATEIRCL